MVGLPVVELLVERAIAAKHAVENIGGNPARGEAGHFRFWRESIAAHVNFISVTTREASESREGR